MVVATSPSTATRVLLAPGTALQGREAVRSVRMLQPGPLQSLAFFPRARKEGFDVMTAVMT